MTHEDIPGHQRHRAEAPERLGVAVITVSDTRTPASDSSGALIVSYLEEAGHAVRARRIVADETAAIEAAVKESLIAPDCDVILLTGGTGVSPRDRTPELVSALADRILTGFGELFRMLSWEEIGAAAMLSRAVAGVKGGRLMVAMPGSTGAVRLAMEQLLLPEMGHIIRELRKPEGPIK